jgi:serine/threonine protein kinase
MKVLAPRLPTPLPPESSRLTSRLPDDVMVEQVQRLAMMGLISGGLWTLGLIMDWVVFPRALGTSFPVSAFVIDFFAAATGYSVFLFARHSKRAAHTKADAGLWLMFLNTACIALLETWVNPPPPGVAWNLSWDTVVILLSAMVMPAPPRKMLIAVLVAASMRPLGIWLAHLRGTDVPSLAAVVAMSIPAYACAVVATLPSRMFHRMGQRLKEARELGSYHLVEKLGEGGMGEVWRARHRLLVRDAAIKLIRPEMLGAGNDASAHQMLRRFEREAQTTATLTSPNTIQLFDFGSTDDGCFYYVMELLVGRNLESFVREFGPLPAERVMYLLLQACHSLSEAHARGLVHRDVKPANIFVCRMGLDYDVVKVLDFGLVKLSQEAPTDVTQSLVTTQQVIGTPAYMAPEVILSAGRADARADVYGLGCVAYFMLTGHRVFDESSRMQALIDHVQAKPAPPSRRTSLSIPRDVDDLVLACLEKDPDNRPQNAGEVGQRIQNLNLTKGWSAARARAWWEAHLPELVRPLAPPGEASRVPKFQGSKVPKFENLSGST